MYLRSSSGKGSGRKNPFSWGDDFSNYWNRDGHGEGMKVCRRDEEIQANGHRTRWWDGLEKGHRSAPSSPVMLSQRICSGDEKCRLFFCPARKLRKWALILWAGYKNNTGFDFSGLHDSNSVELNEDKDLMQPNKFCILTMLFETLKLRYLTIDR